MNTKQVDDIIIDILNYLPYGSQIGVQLQLQLADFAAQRHGFRSTRAIDGKRSDEVYNDNIYLIDLLHCYILECRQLITDHHTYKREILNMSIEDLEDLVCVSLYEMVVLDYRHVFIENFFTTE
jgi:hypothetical protein